MVAIGDAIAAPQSFLTYPMLAGAIAIAISIYFYIYVRKQKSGSRKMVEISDAIRVGAVAYLMRQYQVLAVFVVAVSVALAVFKGFNSAFAYAFGSACSALAGYMGMDIALRGNVRTTNAARRNLGRAFNIAFRAGAVMGLSIVGLALLGISGLYFAYRDLDVVLSFSFGASAMALFAKVGGGIYTKTADIAADLVGKVEKGIPEDDPRNPAVVADNVGDNVGDVAGMGADIIDSYIASVIAAMIVGFAALGVIGALLPLMFAAAGVIASIIGAFLVKARKNPGAALNRGTFMTCALFALLAYVVVKWLGVETNIFYATLVGLIAGVIIGITSDYFTSIDRMPVKKIAEEANVSTPTNILSGFSYGIISVMPPIIGICAATILAWYFAGLYGIAIAAVGMLAIVGMIISADAYGPIVDNAKGIAEQSRLGRRVISIADRLDAAGNTAKAITKGFAIGAAALTVLALLTAYAEIAGVKSINVIDPYVITGIFIGAGMPPLLSALLILSVSKNTSVMIEEVRRQFREIPGLMKGRAKPDYAACVDIATKGALKELIIPSVLSMTIPLIVGILLGKEALGGFLAGSILTGIIFALFMANAGGAWDNAKKYIEAGAFGGKGSEAHKAAVVGDTVGDPFKDTAGPSLNTLICVMSLSASVFAPLILQYALI